MLSKKHQTKQSARLRDDVPVRFSKSKYIERQEIIRGFGLCQVCEESTDMDTPHHGDYGLGKKDDRSLVCICIKCHYEIHSGSYSNIKKTREEIKEIGYNNDKELLKEENC